MRTSFLTALLATTILLLPSSGHAQEPQEERYAPPPAEHPAQVYLGDPHIHTRMSVDASLWGNTLGPADTYEYLRGGAVTSFKVGRCN